jgi:hypothetical protein
MPVKTPAELRQMQADPRYWQSNHPGHADYVRQVDAEYRRAYPETGGRASLNPGGR